MADKEISRSVLNEIQSRRIKEARQIDPTHGLQALAEYAPVSLGTIEHLLDLGKTPQELVTSFCTATLWKCRDSTGKTAREAFERAEAVRAEGRQRMQRDLSQAAATGLPVLIGTPRQIDWATSLRAAHLKHFPDSVHKKQKKAAWWIEHRQEL